MENLKDRLMEDLTVEQLQLLTNDINSFNGDLEHLAVYDMDDFEEITYGIESHQLMRMAYFGSFNPMDNYFAFNGYGNFESYSDWDFEDLMIENKELIVDTAIAINERGYIDVENYLNW